jgi:beta-N-acetylhexosaminidase
VCDGEAAVRAWPVERRIAQVMMVGVDPRSGDEAADIVGRYGIGGIFIGGDATGIFTDGTLARLGSLNSVSPLVAVDEEGGRVQRIDTIAGPIPAPRRMAETMSPGAVHELALARGLALRKLGVTMDFAPVVDVSEQSDKSVIGDRSFSNDPQTVIDYGGAFAQGLRDAGVVPVLKHFPGHGHAQGDSHVQSAVAPPLDRLRGDDLVPYQHLLSGTALGVMVGHLEVPGLTNPNEPSSISPNAIDGLLRGDLAYHGFVITDDLSGMLAITSRFDTPEASRRALIAGADMVLLVRGGQFPQTFERLVADVKSGTLDDRTLVRAVLNVLAVKGIDPCS